MYGDDLEVLSSLGLELAGLMHQLPQVTHVRAGMQRDLPRLVLDVDHTALSDAGLTTQSLAEQVGAALSGQPAGMLLEDTQQLSIRVRYADGWRTDAEQLAALRLVSDQVAEGLPLAAVADSDLAPLECDYPTKCRASAAGARLFSGGCATGRIHGAVRCQASGSA